MLFDLGVLVSGLWTFTKFYCFKVSSVSGREGVHRTLSIAAAMAFASTPSLSIDDQGARRQAVINMLMLLVESQCELRFQQVSGPDVGELGAKC